MVFCGHGQNLSLLAFHNGAEWGPYVGVDTSARAFMYYTSPNGVCVVVLSLREEALASRSRDYRCSQRSPRSTPRSTCCTPDG